MFSRTLEIHYVVISSAAFQLNMTFLRSISRTATQNRNRCLIVKSVHLANLYVAELFSARRAQRHYVRHELDLRKLPADQLKSMFRVHYYEDLERFHKLLRLPPIVMCGNRISVSLMFALAVVLRRLASRNRWVDRVDSLGRERSQLSRIFNTTNILYGESMDICWSHSINHGQHKNMSIAMRLPWVEPAAGTVSISQKIRLLLHIFATSPV